MHWPYLYGGIFQKEKNPAAPSVSLQLVAVLFAGIALYELYKFFKPTEFFTVAEAGYQDKTNGRIPWNRVTQIYLEDGDVFESRKGKQEYLVMDYWDGNVSRSIQKPLRNTSVKSTDLEKAIKVYLARHNKNAITKLAFGKKAV